MHEDINYFSGYYDDDNKPFSMEITGVSYCDGSYHIKRRKSKVLVIEYVESGHGTVINDGVTFTASAGDIYILRQDHDHEYYSSADDPWIKKFFNLKGRLLEDLLRLYSLGDAVVVKNCEAVKPLFDEMYELSCKKDELGTERLFEELSVSFHRLIIEIGRIFNQNSISDSEMIKVKSYIDNNLNRIVSNDELSDIIFRSNDYIVKNFKSTYGSTPYDYQISQKISVAKSLLADTVLPIGSIARMLGYSDQHYFSNLFRQKCGISPLKYRKSKK